jgi:prolyl-tRNA synthetase
MGSYGIGIERIAAAYIEVNSDENGIIWGGEISPFDVEVISISGKNENVKKEADGLYSALIQKNIDVLYDDRDDLSPGVKFKDADLIGIPVQVIVSEKNLKNSEIELKIRRSGERIKLPKDSILNKLTELLTQIKSS